MKAAVIESIASGFTFADINVGEPEEVEVLTEVKTSGLSQAAIDTSEA